MAVRIVRLGTPRAPGEGTRFGTVRRPPRGVPKDRFAAEDWYDVWLPVLAPSAGLMADGRAATTDAEWARFIRGYEKEMAASDPAGVLDALARLSHSADFAVGCYCEDESHCHRSALRRLLADRDADIVD
jgi:uncharacterized protein YeaO (DUF488 family)